MSEIDFDRTRLQLVATKIVYDCRSDSALEGFLDRLPSVEGNGSIEHRLPEDFGVIRVGVRFESRFVNDRWAASVEQVGIVEFAKLGEDFRYLSYRDDEYSRKGSSTFYIAMAGFAEEDRATVFCRVVDKVLSRFEDLIVHSSAEASI